MSYSNSTSGGWQFRDATGPPVPPPVPPPPGSHAPPIPPPPSMQQAYAYQGATQQQQYAQGQQPQYYDPQYQQYYQQHQYYQQGYGQAYPQLNPNPSAMQQTTGYSSVPAPQSASSYAAAAAAPATNSYQWSTGRTNNSKPSAPGKQNKISAFKSQITTSLNIKPAAPAPTSTPAYISVPPTAATQKRASTEPAQSAAKSAKKDIVLPESAKNYVKRVFAICSGQEDFDAAQKFLQETFTLCADVNAHNWDNYPLIPKERLPSQKKKLVPKTVVDNIQKLAQRMDRFGSPKMSKKQKQKQNKQKNKGLPVIAMNMHHTRIVGTNMELEKAYYRLTSAPEPSTVRPFAVLQRALAHLRDKYKRGASYKWISSQLKAVRQDLIVQRIRCQFTVKAYETHARIALENGDMSEFHQCQAQLAVLYDEDIEGHRIEFQAYRILYFCFTNNNRDVSLVISELDDASKQEPAIKHALDVRTSVALNNYAKFFRLFKAAPNMGAYLMDLFVERMRTYALIVMAKAIRPSLTIEYIQKELAFDTPKECIELLRKLNISFNAKGTMDCKQASDSLAQFDDIVKIGPK